MFHGEKTWSALWDVSWTQAAETPIFLDSLLVLLGKPVSTYPLVNIQKAIDSKAIEIVDLPINSMVIFHSYVILPEGIRAAYLQVVGFFADLIQSQRFALPGQMSLTDLSILSGTWRAQKSRKRPTQIDNKKCDNGGTGGLEILQRCWLEAVPNFQKMQLLCILMMAYAGFYAPLCVLHANKQTYVFP